MKIRISTVVVTLAILAFAQVAVAATYQWTNATGDGIWSTPGNWSSGVLPGPGDTAEIGTNAAAATIAVNSAVTVGAVTMSNANATNPHIQINSGVTFSATSSATIGTGCTITTVSGRAVLANSNVSGTLSTGGIVTNQIDFTGAGTALLNNGASFTGSGEFRINGSHVRVPGGASVTIPNLTLLGSGAILGGAGTSTLTGTITWRGGALGSQSDSGGLTIIDSAATVNITAQDYYAMLRYGRTLTNNGTIVYIPAGATYNFQITEIAQLNNAGTFDIQTDMDITGGASDVISNSGTLQKSGGAGMTVISPQVLNSGTVSTSTGQLALNGSGSASGAPIFSAAGTTRIEFNGTYTLTTAATFNGPGKFWIGGTLVVSGGVSVTVPNLSMVSSSSTLAGTGTITLTGAATWSGGTMGRSGDSGGTTVVDSAATLAITGGAYYASLRYGRTLTNNGSIAYSAPSPYYFSIQDGSTLNNPGIFSVQTDLGIEGGTTSVFNNTGTLQKTAGAGTSVIRVRLDHSGSVSTSSGHVSINGGGSANGTPSFSAAASSNIDFASVYTLNATTSFGGAGAYRINGGTLVVPGGVSVSIPNLSLMTSNSFLAGAGNVTLMGVATWAGGGMGHSTFTGGTTIVDSAAILNITGSSYYPELRYGRTLQNNGTITYSSASLYLSIYDASTLNNAGTFEIQTDADINAGGATPNVISNSGSFLKTAGTATTIISPRFDNSGSVSVSNGILSFNGGGSTSGSPSFAAVAGSNIDFGSVYSLTTAPTFTGPGGFRINNGNLVTPTGVSVTIPNLSILTSGSYLSGAGTVTLTGTVTWAAGAMGQSSFPGGTTTIDSAAVVNLTDISYKYLDQARTLQNDGRINYSATTYQLHIYNGSILNNAGMFDLQSDLGINISGANTFNNTGTLQKSGGTGTSTFFCVLNNDGAVDVTSGTLSLNAGGTHSGSFTATSPGSVNFGGGTHNAGAGSTFSGTGTIGFTAGTTTIGGLSYGVNTTSISGSGTANFNISASTAVLSFAGGELGGTGTFNVTTSATWSGGTMRGPGSTVFDAGVAVSMPDGAYKYLDGGRLLTNLGTITYNPITYYLSIYNGSTLDNAGTFDVQSNRGVDSVTGATNTFNNSGTFRKSAGTGISNFVCVVNNSGIIEVTSGELSLNAGGTHSGSFAATSPGVLDFGGGVHNAGAGSAFSGTGTMTFTAGTTAIGGTSYSVSATGISGSGTVNFNINASTSILNFANGELGGTGTFNVTGSATWSGGTMRGPGTTVFDAGIAISMPDGQYKYLDGARLLTNQGTITYNPNTYYLSIYNGSTFNNAGTFDVQSNRGVESVTGATNTFNNSGTFRKSGGTGISNFICVVNNSGSIEVTSGELSLNGGGTHSGSFTVTSPAILDFGGGTHAAGAGSTFSGTGTTGFSGGTTTIGGGSYSVNTTSISGSGTATFNINASTAILTFAAGELGGTATFTVTGSGTWSGGTMRGPGTTVFDTGTAVAMPDGNYKYLDGGRLLRNLGTITYNPNTYYLSIYNGSTLDNAGLFDVQSNRGVDSVTGATNTFINTGTFRKSGGTGISNFICVVNNSGSIEVTTGELSLNGGGTYSGSVAVTSPGILDFGGGTHSAGAGSTFSGTGTIGFSAGTTTIGGASYGVNTTSISNSGTANFNINASTAILTFAAGELGGTATFTVTGSGTWSGGTMRGPGATVFDTGTAVAMPDGNYKYLDGARLLRNLGTITYNPATYYLSMYNGSTFDNAGTFDVQSNRGVDAISGASNTFNNSGTFLKSGGTGVSTFACVFTNSGSLRSQSGTIAFNGGFTQSAGITSLEGGSISSSVLMNINGGTLAGTGTVTANVNAGAATVAPGLSPGILTIGGNLTLSPSTVVAIEVAGITAGTGYDQLAVTGNAVLAGSLIVTTTFAPPLASTYQILTYPSRSGDFASRSLSFAGGSYSYSNDPTEYRLIATSSSVVTFTVVNTNDSGAGSLRQAILDVNGCSPAPCAIDFAIPGTAPFVIPVPSTPLPAVQVPVIIDGLTQPGVEIDGSGSPATAGLEIQAGSSIVRGLMIRDFASGSGIVVSSGTGTVLTDNSIHSNGGIAIDLGGDGATANDATDADTGANNLQNFPVMTAVVVGSDIVVQGDINSSTPAPTSFRFDIYRGDGTEVLDTSCVAASGGVFSGVMARFLASGIGIGDDVVATATGYSAGACTGSTDGTSEFSAAATITSCTPPPAVITVSGSTALCPGGSVILTASAGTSYVWSTGATTQSITVTTPGTYSVTVTDSIGCSATSSPVTVTSAPAPVATISAPPSVCSNSTGHAASTTVQSGATYTWSMTNGTITAGQGTAAITFDAGATGPVTVALSVTNSCGTVTNSVAVAVSEPPAAITAPASVCSNSTGNSASTPFVSGATYSWTISGGTITSGQNTSAITFAAAVSGSVVLDVVVSAGGCSASATRTIPITIPVTPTITASGPTTFCGNGSVVLTASAGTSYLWSTGETTSSILVTSGGSYSVTVTDASGCTATSAPTVVTLDPAPSVTINGPSSICPAGSEVSLQAISSDPAVTYLWSTGETTPSILVTPSADTTYSVTVTASNGCTASDSHRVSIARPETLTINAPSSVRAGSTNSASTSGGTPPYRWSVTNGSIRSGQGTSEIRFRAGSSGTVFIRVTEDVATCPATGNLGVPIGVCPDEAPQPTSPAPGAGDLTSPVTFRWIATNGAARHDVVIVRPDGSTFIAGSTTGDSLVADIPSGSFEWFVTAQLSEECEPSVLMSTRSAFTVVPLTTCPNAAPAIVSPQGGESRFSPISFDWNPVPDAIGYRVMASLGGQPAVEIGTVGDEETSLVAVIPPGSVRWWVEAIYSGCPSSASDDIEFGVEHEDCSKHQAAQLIEPPANATTASSEVAFRWSKVEGADGYAVWVVVDGEPEVYGNTVGALRLTTVIPPGTHEWYVETLFEGCASTFSERRPINVPAASDCPTAGPNLAAPSGNAVLSSPRVTFTWSSVPDALLYELWLSIGGGAPALVESSTTSVITREVPRGEIEWFVRARVNGCSNLESERGHFRYEPPAECGATAPNLLMPLDDARGIASPIDFRWSAVPQAQEYRLWVVRGTNAAQLMATTSEPEANDIAISTGDARWYVEASFGPGCAMARSTESSMVVVAAPPSCTELTAPVLSVPSQASADHSYTVRWTSVPGADLYRITESPGGETTTTATEKTFRHPNGGNDAQTYFYSVRAVDTDCEPDVDGALSGGLGVTVLSARNTESSSLIGAHTTTQHVVTIGAEFAGQTFVVTPAQSWISVTPATGVVGAEGTDLTVTADLSALPLGTSVAGLTMQFSAPSSGRVATHGGGSVSTSISVNLVTPVTPTPKSSPPPDALIIPAVAHAEGINAQFETDVRVTNTSPRTMKYQLTFVPSGAAGMTLGRQTTMDVDPGRTIALDDVLRTWFATADQSVIGTLEIRPLTQSSSSTSNAAVRGVPNLVTFASSRTFNTTPNGTFGTYIAAIPYANFVGRGATTPGILSLQQIAQSDQYRTNLGFVEGSGNPVELLVSVFNNSGSRLDQFPVALSGGQHMQIGSFLAQRGVYLEDGRLEVQVTSGTGKVTAYAAVVNHATGDSLVVSPVSLDGEGSSKYVLPGVAELSASTPWQTDVRLFNSSDAPVTATLTLQSMNGNEAQSATVDLAAGEVRQLDRVLSALFGVTNDGGALHITTATAAKIIATARTYRPSGDGGNFGQFIQAVTPEEAIGAGSRPLQILQVEESPRFRSNVGLAEVSGKPVKVEVAVIPPDAKVSARIEVDLAANQFRQLNSLLSAMGLTSTHNARVTVRVLSGEGRVTAYAATIDALTNDPTFIPAQ